MCAYVDAFGDDDLIWKFHEQLHQSEYIAKWGFSLNTLALERKHKGILQIASDRSSDSSVEFVLRDFVSRFVATVSTADWLNLDVGLISPKNPSK
eukprot:7585927-Karenia_brevis.AAC.1